ncbi:MAG: CDP-diacylglycerol--glycerol-3-phosphate 3-phosphatidyltransferase [Defluviitaleaceae bacterium]|nr:CDP-diacylglycerol--glycerol-3-phosphate 3-phosphatidyltransferase [Defluviitaleaceae bacterium]
MNIANKLTILRIVLIPFFILCFYMAPLNQPVTLVGFETTYANALGLLIFSFAAATDWLDGYLARKLNLISDFGKFMDPLADKMLTTAAFLIFINQGLLASWIVFIILTREFIVSGLRMTAAAKGTVIAAAWSGKFKTVLQFILVIALLIHPVLTFFNLILIYAMTVATVVSGTEYVVKNMTVFK